MPPLVPAVLERIDSSSYDCRRRILREHGSSTVYVRGLD